MSDNPTLYIMCGLPFAGKTYTSKLICERLGCQRVSYDELWSERKAVTGRSVPYDILMPEAQEMITALLRRGQSVVFDTLNDTVNNREELRNLASKAGAHLVVIYLKVPRDVLLRRQAQNKKTNARHAVADDTLAEAFVRFEPPINEAGVVEFQHGDDLSERIAQLQGLPMGEHPISEQIVNLLKANNCWFEHFNHEPVRTSEDAAALREGYTLQQGAKALIMRVKVPNEGKKFVMLVMPADQKFDSNKVRNLLRAKDIRFATEAEVETLTGGIKPGGVPPFGNLFGMEVVSDRSLYTNEKIVFNAGRTSSIGMKSADYKRLVNPMVGDII